MELFIGYRTLASGRTGIFESGRFLGILPEGSFPDQFEDVWAAEARAEIEAERRNERFFEDGR